MPKWEYDAKVVEISREAVQKELVQATEEGWQLVSVVVAPFTYQVAMGATTVKRDSFVLFLKRPLGSEKAEA